jgi:cysteine-rich repeat protein
VAIDDAGGQTGMLRSWSLSISTLPSFQPSPPVTFQGAGANLPNGNLTGFSSPVSVSGLGPRVLDVNVTVDITETNAADIDLFLTSPSGKRIDLVTDIGGGNDGLYIGTVFDDQAGTPIADLTLPPDLTAFTTVVGEGALSAFLGDDPNGTWTLTAVDDAGGNASRLNGWTLVLSASSCGDGNVDTGEACDDGNTVAGDGCEPTCTVTVPGGGGGGCQGCTGAEDCSNCVDDDSNGLVDGLDPACAPTSFQLTGVAVSFPRGLARSGLRLTGDLRVPDGATGSASVALADANGVIACVPLGPLVSAPRRTLVARSGQGNVKVRGDGHLVMRGVGLDMSLLDDPTVSVGVTVGNASFSAAGTLRAKGRSKRVFP